MRHYALAICLILLPVTLIAITIHVPADQPTIQAGIDAASVGDTVLVHCGVYYESNIELKSGIILRSEDGQIGCVTVDAQDLGRVFHGVNLDATVIEGLIIQNGQRNGYRGGGMYIEEPSNITIRECRFESNSANTGGGIFAISSSCVIERCEFISNISTDFHDDGGGGIRSIGSNLVLLDSWFQGNSAAIGGGCRLSASGGSSVSMTGCVFDSNSATSGGACHISWFEQTISGCSFYGNTAEVGGALSFSVSSPTLAECTFSENLADEGGAIHHSSGDAMVLDQCTVTENSANHGGGIYLNMCDAFIHNSIFWMNNTVWDSYFGEISFSCSNVPYPYNQGTNFDGDPQFCMPEQHDYHIGSDSPCAPENNDCEVLVGAFPVACMYSSILVEPDGSGDVPTIQDALSLVDSPEDTVLLADGVYQGYGNRDLQFGDFPAYLKSLSQDPTICIIDCQGTESEPHRGFIFQSGETSEAVIEGITIKGGYTDEGGAIKCENGSSPTIRNCILRENYATSGGAIHSDSSSPIVENCTISYNSSPTAGAAFLLYSDVFFENCILSHSIDGPAVFGYESNPLLSCTDVVWNEGGDWIGCIADQQNQNGNFSNTPAFCDPENGDFRLQSGSPCLPEHNACGVLVGALGEGDCAPTGVEELPSSARIALEAYPNPFNPHLTIMFTLPDNVHGSLVVHDVSGRRVRLLKEGLFAQGANEIIWNGLDNHGRDVASGVYFVRLLTLEKQESRKIVLLR